MFDIPNITIVAHFKTVGRSLVSNNVVKNNPRNVLARTLDCRIFLDDPPEIEQNANDRCGRKTGPAEINITDAIDGTN